MQKPIFNVLIIFVLLVFVIVVFLLTRGGHGTVADGSCGSGFSFWVFLSPD